MVGLAGGPGRALGQTGGFIATESKRAVQINLYPAAEITLPEHGLRLVMTGDFPRMTRARIRVECEKPASFSLALRIPPWATSMQVKCDGVPVDQPKTGRRVVLTRRWKGATLLDLELGGGLRTARWPAGGAKRVALFDGPLCLGLSSAAVDVDLPWAVLVDASGQPVLDPQGRPQAGDPSGHKTSAFAPVGTAWLTPDVQNPARKRVLFQTKTDTKS